MNAQKAIDEALHFLAAAQRKDGGFASFSSPADKPWQPVHTYRTVLVPALILAALCHVDHPTAAPIRERLTTFLLHQKSAFWSFNYWARDSREAQKFSYPDDLDDTFCALYALGCHDPAIINEQVLANMARILIATESAPGGPYRTWLIDSKKDVRWHDIDVAVNANIAAFLAIAAEPLPPLAAFLENAMQQRMIASPYYPNEMPVLYYLSRAVGAAGKADLHKRLLHHTQGNGTWSTPLHTALATTALRNSGHSPPQKALRFLLKTQTPDGSWPSEAFCHDPKRAGQLYYHGCPALTTAFAIEALHTPAQSPLRPRNRDPKPQTRSPIFAEVIRQAGQELTHLDSDIRQVAVATLERTTKSRNSQEIILLPQLFSTSLRHPAVLSQSQLVQLGLANLYGWMAYTIYDDFLDNEPQPSLLGVANLAMRRSLQAFVHALPENRAFQKQVAQTFDAMDGANTWEVTHCRWTIDSEKLCPGALPNFGDLSQLAAKSLGHTLTPLAVLTATDASPSARRHILTALRHYIIAKQLSDDTHDWKEDLAAGRITYVVATILRQLDVDPDQLQLSTVLPSAERIFWYDVLPRICDNMTYHIAVSRKALIRSSLLRPDNVIEKLLGRIEHSNEETKTTVTQVKTFLHTYNDAQNI